MIRRDGHVAELRRLLKSFPVVAIVGARQVGKTTLARILSSGRKGAVHHFDLEDPRDVALLSDPMLALERLRGLVILDEIHRRPELFPVLRVLADRRPVRTRFLVLGSASPDLLRQGSESLAGRINYYPLPGLSLPEVGPHKFERLWVRGQFPRAFLAKTLAESAEWRRSFIRTFLERDIPSFGFSLPSETLFRFWSMLAHYHGQVWNASEFARSFGVADTTIRRYLDLLTSTFVVRQLQPWTANIKKRQVRSPKVYISDSGLLHALLDIETSRALRGHPKVGASWEGFMLENVIQQLSVRHESCYFWATHTGAELDLLVVAGRKRRGFEFKRTTTPKMTRSMHSALNDLKLTSLDVVHAGDRTFPLARGVRAVAADRLLSDLTP
jgi:predicted AAA+ superfamily ATPase